MATHSGVLARFSLKGKTAVVTGGARGLGLEMMRALAECGASVACVDLLAEMGAQACMDIEQEYKVKATSWACDVTSYEEVQTLFSQIAERHGSIDILVTAAGIVKNVKAEEHSPQDFARIMNVNVNGSFFCCQAAGNHMIKQNNGGSIILIASMSAHIVNKPQPQCSYNASKAAVVHLAKSLACEWAPHKIRVNTVSPGYMATSLTKQVIADRGSEGAAMKSSWEENTPMGRMGEPHELQGSIIYLASEASSFVTGTDLVVDGGYLAW
ncbi:putative secondary metabolism biosynthetic enzyme [Umbelopsis sp. WA50703]